MYVTTAAPAAAFFIGHSAKKRAPCAAGINVVAPERVIAYLFYQPSALRFSLEILAHSRESCPSLLSCSTIIYLE